MTLLEEAMEKGVIMDKSTVSDGYGGYTQKWTEGAEFDAAFRLDTSIQARVGQVQGLTSVYTIITKKDITLEYHDVVRRLSDGKIFRVTSDGQDSKTPNSAGLDMRTVSAEEWQIPNG